MREKIGFGVLTVFLAALVLPASSAEIVPDPDTQRDAAAKLLSCSECHGRNGLPKSPAIPIIWGQQESYLIKQLNDYRTADRKDEIMSWISNTLTQEEKELAAASFAKKTWPAQPHAADTASAPAGIAVCQACHQPDLHGAVQAGGVAAPRLAGQSYEYLVEEMRRYADGERSNNPDMVMIMKSIPSADRDAIAHYLSGL